jgi:hypothetical protein
MWAMALLSGSVLVQAECDFGNENTRVMASTPTSDFIEIGASSLRHDPTRLIWQRCPLGQNWDGVGCTGSAQLYDWQSALQTAESHQQDGASDWRLPNRNELASIVESRCFQPAINATVFPDTGPLVYWTSSQLVAQPGQAWTVQFDHGAVQSANRTAAHAVRLVRENQ